MLFALLSAGAGGRSQAKVLPAGPAGLLPTQFILQHTPPSATLAAQHPVHGKLNLVCTVIAGNLT